jgi:hypothetical protein
MLFRLMCLILLSSPADHIQASCELDTAQWKRGVERLPFLTSDMSRNQFEGYIDTFTLNSYCFRIIHHDSLYDGNVERYENGSWVTNLQFKNLGNHNGYSRDRDVNNDGYNDIVFYKKWDSDVFLFNKRGNNFYTTSFQHPQEWTLIDSAKNIFCDFFGFKFADKNTSKLYKFHGDSIETLYHLSFDEETIDKDRLTIRKVILFNAVGKRVRDFPINSPEFDYIEFWKKFYLTR